VAILVAYKYFFRVLATRLSEPLRDEQTAEKPRGAAVFAAAIAALPRRNCPSFKELVESPRRRSPATPPPAEHAA